MKKRARDDVTAILRYAARGDVEALEDIAAELKSQITAEQPRRRAEAMRNAVDSAVAAYRRQERRG